MLYLRTSKLYADKLNQMEERARDYTQPSSQLITLKSQIFPVKNANLRSSGSVGLVTKSSDFKTTQDFECHSIFFPH